MRNAGGTFASYLSRAGFVTIILAVIAGCASTTGQSDVSLSGGTATPTATIGKALSGGLCVSPDCAARDVRAFVEPDAGVTPITRGVSGATRSIWVEVYLLTDRTVIHALEDAASRGVDVRVMLEAHQYGGGDVQAARMLEELRAAGVHAESASPAFTYTHAKIMLIDSATAYILTCNLTLSGLGGSSSFADRDYGVIDTNQRDVAALAAIYQADWNRTDASLGDPRLVVSPINARAEIGALIASAKTTLAIEDEEMYDRAAEDAMIAAARRGVSVTVLLPSPSAGAAPSTDVARLLRGGVHVRYLGAPYLHAKLILVDHAIAFAGSENFSATSLDHNREIGIVLSDPAALSTLTTAYNHDAATASAA
jgi:phosphatidylserine/phosphatidylglycerophosphate/cardiolipin synthase-like enzyme